MNALPSPSLLCVVPDCQRQCQCSATARGSAAVPLPVALAVPKILLCTTTSTTAVVHDVVRRRRARAAAVQVLRVHVVTVPLAVLLQPETKDSSFKARSTGIRAGAGGTVT